MMSVYSINENNNRYRAPRGDPRIDPRRLEALERENMYLKGQLKTYKNLAEICASKVDIKADIAEVLFEHAQEIPEGLYLTLMNMLKN